MASTHTAKKSRCVPRGYQAAESRHGAVISGKFCPFEKHMEKVHPVIPQETWSPFLIIHIRQEPWAIASRAERIKKKTLLQEKHCKCLLSINKLFLKTSTGTCSFSVSQKKAPAFRRWPLPFITQIPWLSVSYYR